MCHSPRLGAWPLRLSLANVRAGTSWAAPLDEHSISWRKRAQFSSRENFCLRRERASCRMPGQSGSVCRACPMTSARLVGSSGWTRNPVLRLVMSSRKAGRSLVTTMAPQSIASNRIFGIPSRSPEAGSIRHGSAQTWAAAKCFLRRVWGTKGRRRTLSAILRLAIWR